MRHRFRKAYRIVMLTVAGAMASMATGPSATAHPHVFIDNISYVQFEDGKITGLRFHWTFDDIFSFLLFEDFDKDKTKSFDEDEVQALRDGAFEALKELQYFTHIRIDGKLLPVPRVADFKAIAKNGRVSYSFTVPFDKPVDPRKSKLSFGVYDATFYVSVVHDAIDPVRFTGDSSQACHFKLGEDKENPIYYGMVFPKKVDVVCATS